MTESDITPIEDSVTIKEEFQINDNIEDQNTINVMPETETKVLKSDAELRIQETFSINENDSELIKN